MKRVAGKCSGKWSMKRKRIKIKDQDIVLLQKNQLQQSRLEKAGLVKNFTIAGIAVAAVISSYFTGNTG
jgi:hypothetical protein